MLIELSIVGGMLAASVALDAAVFPRSSGRGPVALRSLPGMWFQGLVLLAATGLFLALTGNLAASAILALAAMGLLVVVSNAKHRVLGEPLLFSDLALFGAVFRHPQFYLTALRTWQIAAIVCGAVTVVWLLWRHSVADAMPHAVGLTLMLASPAMIHASMRTRSARSLMTRPDAESDVERHGLLATLLVYWLRWRASIRPPAAPTLPEQNTSVADDTPQVVVIIQCESFADPTEIFGADAEPLAALSAARKSAWQAGDLQVSGFGAYTMRTEYGVVFGRDDAALGFRQYDPFLTALDDPSYALPNRLAGLGWRSLFLHPHDMRFYGRDAIMPAGGFAELIGQDRFAPPAPGEGRYVTDAAMADVIVELARAAQDRTLLYAVTIENHGPWKASVDGSADLAASYLALARNSDAMLERLSSELSRLGRPAMLVFFGDHRPSIPGLCDPGSARHTPYVIMRYDGSGQPLTGHGRQIDLTPAQLHHGILALVTGGRTSS